MSTTVRDIGELLPVAQTACRLFLEKCQEAGLDVFVTETYRSQERQNELYEQGRTKPGHIVTWTKNSRHTSRLAWDIAVNPPKALYDVGTLEAAGAVAAGIGITWDGAWITPDRPHFEVTADWKAPEEEGKTMYYQTVDSLPEWGRETIQKLVEAGAFADPELLNLSEDMLRVFVILDRVGGIGRV